MEPTCHFIIECSNAWVSLSSSDEEAMKEEPIPTQGCGGGHVGSVEVLDSVDRMMELGCCLISWW